MFILLTFLFGLIVGSFLNVLVLRYHTGASVVWDRSACFSCGKTLTWKELVPVLSFLAQRGRCATCKSAISWQYPLVELLTAGLFASIAYKLLPALFLWDVALLVGAFVTASLFVVVIVYDIKHKIIPDLYIYLLIGISVLSLFVGDGGLAWPTYTALFAGPALATPFALLWLISKGKWMGFGDAKIALAIGWLLGLSQGFLAILLAFITGSIVGVLLILLGKFRTLFIKRARFTMKSEIPFGPFLALGTWAVWYWNVSFLYVFALIS